MNDKQLRRASVVALSVLGLWAGISVGVKEASGEPDAGPPDDGVPSGTIAFFHGGACPAGWKVAEQVQGRLIVGVNDGEHGGVAVGVPLGDQEERQHQHTFKGQVALPDKVIAAADGPNENGAQAKSYDVTGSTTKEASGLPFVQVQACEKP